MSLLMISCMIIGGFSALYYIYLIIFGGGAGFKNFWLLMILVSLISSAILHKYDSIKEHIPKIVTTSVKIIIVIVVLSFLLIEAFIIKDSTKRETYEPTDYVVVLGAGLHGSNLSLTLYHRLNVAVDYLNTHKHSKVIVSGGQGPGEDMTEAEAMYQYLVRKGINEDRIIKEEQSTSTNENIQYSFQLIEKDMNPSVSIITSDFHVFRAKLIAREQGKKVQGIPSKTFPPLIINYYVREYFAVIKDLVF